jgi:hypothetical protein
MKTFRPGEFVTLEGMRYKVMATNFEGKLILSPAHVKESIADMAVRLQSTVPNEESTLRVKESGEAEQRP